MNSEEFFVKAAGVPFTPFGRDFDGWDCWGLVYQGYKNVKGIELPTYVQDYVSPEDTSEIAGLIRRNVKTNWSEVSRPIEMDVILLRIGLDFCHVSLVMGDGRMMHVERDVATAVEAINGLRWGKRIVGYYRHTSLM